MKWSTGVCSPAFVYIQGERETFENYYHKQRWHQARLVLEFPGNQVNASFPPDSFSCPAPALKALSLISALPYFNWISVLVSHKSSPLLSLLTLHLSFERLWYLLVKNSLCVTNAKKGYFLASLLMLSELCLEGVILLHLFEYRSDCV